MKFGLLLHPERGVDAVFEEARLADQQGYDSIWLGDHLMAGQNPGPNQPLDSFTLMASLAGITTRTRLAWSMLNVGFRNPAHLAKMLSTLDVISKGRVIAALGAGSFPGEYEAYNIPLLDHDGRVEYMREVVELFQQLWSRPGPDRVTYEGKHVRTKDLAFAPAPVQRPLPIWLGGESDATLSVVKDLADGWVMLTRGGAERQAQVLNAPDWPKDRPIDVVRMIRLFVGESRQQAVDEAAKSWEKNPVGVGGAAQTFEDFAAREIVGDAEECLARVQALADGGATYLRLAFDDLVMQERAARLVVAKAG